MSKRTTSKQRKCEFWHYIISSMSQIKMKLYLILLLLVCGFLSSYAHQATKDISCQQTLINDKEHGAIYDVTCTDFSSSVEPKNRIDQCVLTYFTDNPLIWGWRFLDVTRLNWIHPVGLWPPTNISCSLKIRPTDELTSVVETKFDDSTGKYRIVASRSTSRLVTPHVTN